MMERSKACLLSPRAGSLIALRPFRHRALPCVLGPGAGSQYLVDLRKREVAFFLAVVEMGRNADTRLWPVIYQNITRQQLAADCDGVRRLERNRPGALRRILRRIHPPPAGFCAG